MLTGRWKRQTVLTGRESLLRVIGKRRRFLPNRRSFLSTSSAEIRVAACKEDDDVTEKKNDLVEVDRAGDDESVNCPVCEAKLPAHDNTLINSHLDKCLSRGSKRKLGQLTLLQLNFSRTKVKVQSFELEDEKSRFTPCHASGSGNISCDLIHDFNEADKSEGYSDNQNESKFHNADLKSYPLPSCESHFLQSSVTNKLPSAPSLLETTKSGNDVGEDFDAGDMSTMVISTFIVGRRFGSKHDLNLGSRISLSRDPDNDKDTNAIKVLFEESGHDSSLGYLPKELSQHLSPLIDTFQLNFEARITSVPKSPVAAIPIHIECKDVMPCGDDNGDKIQIFKCLWRDAVHAADSATSAPSRTTRYQQNLVLLIEEVLGNNPHLFTSSEKSFLEAFVSLPDESQRLFARLYTRKGPWFRMSNISYPEIADCNQAVKALIEEGYMVSFPWRREPENNDFEEVLNVLSVDELREASHMLNLKCQHGTRKHEIIDLLLSSCKTGLSPKLQSFVLATTGSCVRISPLSESLIWRAERLFFLNGDQDLSAFLLVDIGIVKYPSYNCIVSEPIFQHRSALLAYEEAVEIAQIMDESLDENNPELICKCIEISASRLSLSSQEAESSTCGKTSTFLSYFSASWIYSKVVLLGVSFFEHDKRYSEAINLLRQLLSTFICDGRRGYWTLRLSLDLEHLGRLDDSLQVAEGSLPDPWVRAGSRIALQRRILRLGKPPRRWKVPSFSESVKRKIPEVNVQGRPLNCKTGTKSIFYGEDGEQCGVEELALQYYASEGGDWQGVHTESGIWRTLFGILMWEIVFADVPNVFRTKFQTAPLDLETDSFYETRKDLIEALLKKIQEGMAEEILITSWESHLGTACRGVDWEKLPLTDLRAVVKCIGGHCLAAILRHLAQGYRSWASGMPDLVLWRLHDCYRGEAKLVEVKGPRDRLSEQQRAWLLVLMDCGFSVEVCKVTPAPPSANDDLF